MAQKVLIFLLEKLPFLCACYSCLTDVEGDGGYFDVSIEISNILNLSITNSYYLKSKSETLAQAACVRHACLQAPCVLAGAMRSLAIVITIVQSFFLSLLSSVFCF